MRHILQLAYLLGFVFFCLSFLQCLVVTEFQAKKMGIWGIPCLLAFFLLKSIRYIAKLIKETNQVWKAGKKPLFSRLSFVFPSPERWWAERRIPSKDPIRRFVMKTRSPLAERITDAMRQKTQKLLCSAQKNAEVVQVAPERPDQPPMILLSCRVPMGTRYMNRGKHRFRLVAGWH